MKPLYQQACQKAYKSKQYQDGTLHLKDISTHAQVKMYQETAYMFKLNSTKTNEQTRNEIISDILTNTDLRDLGTVTLITLKTSPYSYDDYRIKPKIDILNKLQQKVLSEGHRLLQSGQSIFEDIHKHGLESIEPKKSVKLYMLLVYLFQANETNEMLQSEIENETNEMIEKNNENELDEIDNYQDDSDESEYESEMSDNESSM